MKIIVASTLLLLPLHNFTVQTEKVFTYTQQKKSSTTKTPTPTCSKVVDDVYTVLAELTVFTKPATIKAIWGNLTKKN